MTTPRKLETHEIPRMNVDEFKRSTKTPLVLILDNLRSQNNIGSIFRTADAFLLDGIALCGITATPPSREIHKTALGATDSVDWQYFSSTQEAISHFKDAGYFIAALEQAEGCMSMEQVDFRAQGKWAVIIGNEVHGVDDEALKSCDMVIEIPQYGTKHSLNVSIAAGILCWEFFKSL